MGPAIQKGINRMEDQTFRKSDGAQGPRTKPGDRGTARIKKTRKGKQVVMGALFLVLLGLGWIFPLIGYFIPLCMAAGVGMAFFKGRKWCNWYCPRGSFADGYMKCISPGRRIPVWLRGLPLRIGVLTFLLAMLGFQITRLWPDFTGIGGFFMVLLTITTALGVILALAVHQRAWCYICPIGTMSNWVGRNKYPLAFDEEKCVECNACAKSCPMQLSPYSRETTGMEGQGDCLKCGLCVATCPKSALTFK